MIELYKFKNVIQIIFKLKVKESKLHDVLKEPQNNH